MMSASVESKVRLVVIQYSYTYSLPKLPCEKERIVRRQLLQTCKLETSLLLNWNCSEHQRQLKPSRSPHFILKACLTLPGKLPGQGEVWVPSPRPWCSRCATKKRCSKQRSKHEPQKKPSSRLIILLD